MNEAVNGAAVSETVDQRPTLDAIAEDLVATSAPEPKQKTAPATPDHPAEADAGMEDTLPVEDTKDEPTPPNDTGDEDEQTEFDFLDELAGQTPDEAETPDPDEPTYRVKVDGEEREVPLSELVRRYSAEGAYDKRMQEATELRNQAQQAAEPYVAEARALHEKLAHVYQHFNQAIFQPHVAEPDPALAETDPYAYTQQLAAFQQDQMRLSTERQQMEQTLQQASAIFQQERKTMLENEATALRKKLPGLAKKGATEQFRKRIAEVAQAHGFTQQDLSAVYDHRLLTLAAEAAAYRDMKAKLAGKGKKATTKKRPMPTRGDNRPKNMQTRKATNMRKALSNARKTGDVDDVALTLII